MKLKVIIFYVLFFFLFSFNLCAYKDPEIQKIKLEARVSIQISNNNPNDLLAMGKMLQDRNFPESDSLHRLSESQTLGLASVCFMRYFLLTKENATNYDALIRMGDICKRWAELTKPWKINKILTKYRLSLHNYALALFISMNKHQKDEKIALKMGEIIQFMEENYEKFFSNKTDCLYWIYISIFDKSISQPEIFLRKIEEHLEFNQTCWQFIKEFDRKNSMELTLHLREINQS